MAEQPDDKGPPLTQDGLAIAASNLVLAAIKLDVARGTDRESVAADHEEIFARFKTMINIVRRGIETDQGPAPQKQ